MPPKTAFVTGANGYIGHAVSRAFVRAGYVVYGLVRSAKYAPSLALDEIIPVTGAIDDVSSHQALADQLPKTLDVLVSTTEMPFDYVPHYNNTVSLLRTLAQRTLDAGGPKPLVLFTSGCKDYGMGENHVHGTPGLAPHTEASPLNAPASLADRAHNAVRILSDHGDVMAPVLLRPTNVYGRSSSFYAAFFQVATQAAAEGAPIVIPASARPDYILHALHVDDCADAYVALAEHYPRRKDEVAGQVFNISARRYETVDEVCRALASEYRVGLRYASEATEGQGAEIENPSRWPPVLIDFPQWTGSDKIRRVTGWCDKRPLFSEALHVYRLAYEAAAGQAARDGGLASRQRERVAANFDGFRAFA
ncbi:NAD dependent epimerase/dehydratase [Canariomyces notabilis]|uniref:NAD dependent epimerase/dehydratase n=1 Tax=Canariomyces notabilis TaxID=2074819 RepID=A0AAN6TET9_9PEZI|nr:NAD dependent epimerase/dehydratase [Canariomyces arenarius]